MIIRQNDKLGSLPAEDRAKLDTWLQAHPYREVLNLVAAPRPEGFGFRTNLRALSRYFNKFLKPDPCAELIDLATHHPEAAERAAAAMIQSQAVLAAATGFDHLDFDHPKFKALLRYHTQTRDDQYRKQSLDYRERALAFRTLSEGGK